ncbi:MAG: exo-alpha-sialidase [Bacteroidales bacterium]|nr:exo-alpha-sialidase [Bacteroidales bacterium]
MLKGLKNIFRVAGLSLLFTGVGLLSAFCQKNIPSAGEVYDLKTCYPSQQGSNQPVYLRESPMNEATVQVFTDGKIKIYYAPNRYSPKVLSMTSLDGGYSWQDPVLELEDSVIWQYPRRTLIDKDGNVHLLVFKRKSNDVLHTILKPHSSAVGMTKAADGWIGAIRGFIQTRSGRLVFAFHRRLRSLTAPFGSSSTTAVYSDDLGKTWIASNSMINAPVYKNYNGNNYGCVEPTLIQLHNGKLWMLCRTQTGYLYHSFSDNEGETWSKGTQTFFHSSNSPASLLRLPDGRIILAWCNAVDSDIKTFGRIYTNREVLHLAISEDDGKTWRGFREIARMPTRNDQINIKGGDLGLAYPNMACAKEGKIILVSGQGEEGGGRVIFLVDPSWLYETSQQDDFSKGLEKWCCYTFTKLTKKPWRTLGPELLEDPEATGGKVLHIRKKFANIPGDGAVWNFPMGRRGYVKIRLKVLPYSKGTAISLTDHYRHPNDPDGEKTAMFTTVLGKGKFRFIPYGTWHEMELSWNLDKSNCRIMCDDVFLTDLKLHNETKTGISYIRFRSVADPKEIDTAGLFIDWIRSVSNDNYSNPLK